MIQVVPCPSCGTQSLLPQQVALEATIRCPSCGLHFVVGEVLLSQFASWEVVDDPLEAQTPESTCERLAVPAVEVPRSVHSRAYASDSIRRNSRKNSPLASILPVVGGGLAAFPLALLILWHGFGRDVGDLGAQVAEYVPWIVPENFHKVQPADPLKRKKTESAPALGTSGFRKFDELSGLGQPTLANPDQEAVGNNDVFSEIRQARDLLDQCSQALRDESPTRKELSLAAYSSLAKLAFSLSEIPTNNPVKRTVGKEMDELGKVIADEVKLQNMLEQGARHWIGENRQSQRFALACVFDVSAADKQDSVWIVTGAKAGDGAKDGTRELRIESPRDLAVELQAGQRWLVMGVVEGAAIDESAPLVLQAQYMHAL